MTQNIKRLIKKTVLVLLLPIVAIATDKPTAEIKPLKENVYRFTYGNYHSIFVVTEEGLFVTDPISTDAAKYLKKELKSRYDLPIRYMAYSHNHVDHSMGGKELIEEGTSVIAHEYAAEDIKWTKVPTAIPNITFNDHLSVQLGTSQIDLQYHGPNNGRGSVSMQIQPANVLYVVDWIVIGRMPYKNLLGYDIHGMIRSTREILSNQSFDLFVGGHAETGTREDVEHYLAYLEALYAAVRDGMLAGKNLETLQQEIKLPEFADLKMYEEWLPLNVAGVYKTLVEQSYFNFRTDIDAQF